MVTLLAHIGSEVTHWVALDLLIPQALRRIVTVLLRIIGALDGVEPDHTRGFLLNQVLGQLGQSGFISKRYNHLKVIEP